jgi:hypothetical protein
LRDIPFSPLPDADAGTFRRDTVSSSTEKAVECVNWFTDDGPHRLVSFSPERIKITVFFTEVCPMRTISLLAAFFTLALLITGCSGDGATKKDSKSSGATDSGQKSAPAKPAKPSEGS